MAVEVDEFKDLLIERLREGGEAAWETMIDCKEIDVELKRKLATLLQLKYP